MSENNLKIWNELRTPPPEALKKIEGGRLKGMTDISPQWRYEALTRKFGPVGFGWTYRIVKLWTESGAADQVCAFAHVAMKICVEDKWSEEFEGIGGSMLTAKETKGLYTSDECYKMAVTDALSVACKMVGVAADVYMGDKFKTIRPPSAGSVDTITEDQLYQIEELMKEVTADQSQFCKFFKVTRIDDLPAAKYETAIKMLHAKRGQ